MTQTTKQIGLGVLLLILVFLIGCFGYTLRDAQIKHTTQPQSKAWDYQIKMLEHEYILMDGERVVSIFYLGGELDSAIMKDNL